MEKKDIAASIDSESISDQPLKNLFSIFGLLVGAGISKFLSRTFIVYPTFTDPNTAGLFAGALTVIVILASAWLNGKFGVYVAAKINARDSTKSIKTSIAWGVSIVSFILYLFATGLLSEFSRINAPLQAQRQNIPESQQAPSHDQQTPSTPASIDSNYSSIYAPQQSPSVSQLDDLRKAAVTTPTNATTWINLGNALMDANQFGQAVAAYDKALALEPDNVNVLVDKGTCFRGLSKFNDAVEQYRKALNINPKHPNGHRNLGIVIYYDLNNPIEGVKELQRYIELAPNAPDADQIRQIISQLKSVAR